MTTAVSPAAILLGALQRTPVLREQEIECVVDRRQTLAEGVVGLVLRPVDGAELPVWTPGAHIDLVLGESLVRQYSLCGSPTERGRWRVAVLRESESRGGSEHIHDVLEEGATLRVRGPRNHFPLVGAPRYVFIAGGIGITPLLPMIESAARSGADWRLLYAGRRRASMAFLDGLAVHGDRVEVFARDERGRPDLAAELGEPRDDTLVYCCGPESLLAAVEEHCAAWPAGSLQVERFAARPITADRAARPDTGFEVLLQQSGVTLTVPPGRSLLDVCEEAGVSILASCREGTCGTCEVAVLDGDLDHRDSVLSGAERESGELMMMCVSRCRSGRLVIDL